MHMSNIPKAILSDLYNLSRLIVKKVDMVEGLVENFKQKNNEVKIIDETVEGFRSIIGEISQDSLVDLFYETLVSNDLIDKKTRVVYIDPGKSNGYKIDDIFKHLYRENLKKSIVGEKKGISTSISINHYVNQVSDSTLKGGSYPRLLTKDLDISFCPIMNSTTILDRKTNLPALPDLKKELDKISKDWRANIFEVKNTFKPKYEEALSL